MKGRIIIELTTQTPDTGSGMPDLGHDAYSLMKELPNVDFKDSNGKVRKLSTKYRVTRVSTDGDRT